MTTYRTSFALLLSSALAAPPLPALADVAPPPAMAANAANAVLPDAPDNLGLGSPSSAIYYARDYAGCVWDSGDDVGACINSATGAANAAGGGTVIVPAGAFGLSTTIVLANGVKVVGAGGANYAVCATSLGWIGASGGAMAAGGSDASGAQLVGAGLGNMCLDGAAVAGTGVKLRSVVWSDFADLYVKRVTTAAYDIDVSATANIGVMFNKFTRDYADLTDAGAVSAKGWLIGPGSTTANTNRNYWLLPIVTYQNGAGFVCGNMDSNEVVGAAIEPTGGGTGTSLDLLGNVSSALQTCRSNRFAGMFGVSGTGAAVAEASTNPSVHNTLYLDKESGAPDPVINSGASLYWTSNLGGLNGGWTMGTALGVASGGTGRSALSAGSLVVGNGSGGLNTTNLIKFGGGCTLSNDGTTPNTVIDIDACSTAEDSGNLLMVQNTAYTKITGAWAVGTGNGCLDTGTVATSSWYYLYQIQRSDTGVVDYLCTATYGSPSLPASYNRKRYIGAIKTDGSAHILAFTQSGNEFTWSAVQQDLNSISIGTTSSLQTLASVPSGYKVVVHLRAEIFKSAQAPKVLFSSPDETDAAVDGTTGNQSIQGISGTGTSNTFRIRTNTAAQFRTISNMATTSLWEVTIGWQDPLIAWQH